MAMIGPVATAVPPHVLEQELVRHGVASLFAGHPRIEAALGMVDRAGVKKRHLVLSLPEMLEERSLTDRNRRYGEEAVALGEHVALDAISRAGLRPEQLDGVITVSCTGFMIPSLDAHLVNRLGLRPDVCRLPITELGCAAGAVALARAADLVASERIRHVLVVSVELPSLTFQQRDRSMANLVSSALFGDGAAACVVSRAAGEASGGAGPSIPRILASRSHLFPDTLGAMGFDLRDTGFHILLEREVSELIDGAVAPLVDAFLAEQGIERSDLAAWVLHPGGRRILTAMETRLGLDGDAIAPSREVLAEFGNLSSASVLFVLAAHQRRGRSRPGDLGLLAAFGPGFAMETLLLRWD